MTSLDQDSLFSLDVVVDTLTLGKEVSCRFPAVAFRLLDFPTLLIYHMEPGLAETIQRKIDADPLYKLPKQLAELQDRHGAYAVQKGKSCLFKVSANTLQIHLQSSPLYVMVIDTYPEVPKLVASCTVALDEIMENIYTDVSNLGLSVPSTHGESGEYQLCNLMGRNSGCVSIGVRLLSLGVGLLPHLPESSVAKLTKKSVVKKETKAAGDIKKETEEEPIAMYDLEVPDVHDMPTQVAIYLEKSVEHLHTQTEKEIQSIATQTKAKKKKVPTVPNKQLRLETVKDEMDDFFVTNAECPPALYFNSQTEMKTGQSLLFSHYPVGLPTDQQIQEEFFSDEDTIRSEDTFSDPELDSREMFKPKPKDLTINQTVQQQPRKKPPAPQQPGHIGNLPILNALLQEIITLQGGQLPTAQTDIVKKVVSKPKRRPPEKAQVDSSPPAKETTESFLTRMASPRHVPPGKSTPRPSSPPGLRKHVCDMRQQEVQMENPPPKTVNKGWIRHQPTLGVKKTKLQYGMTNTQRLRLAKGNPDLLKSLEKEQEERLQKRKQQMMKKWTGVLNKTNEIATEISRHKLEGSSTGRPEGVPLLDLDESFDLRHRHKKPVPTPRQSISARGWEDDYSDVDSDKHCHSPVPPITPRKSLLNERVKTIPEHDTDVRYMHPEPELNSHSSRTQSSRIEVHVPTASVGVDDGNVSDATSMHDSELGDVPRPGKVFGVINTKYNPGFPVTDVRDSRFSVVDSRTSNQYSEDFDVQTSTIGEEPDLKRMVDKYSDDSDSQDVNHPGTATFDGVSAGEELGLKCVVETYSENDSSSRKSSQSYVSDRSDDKHINIQIPTLPNPSSHSPDTIVSTSKPKHDVPTRQPFTAVSMNDALSATQDSTAYLRRSQLSSQLSVDSLDNSRPPGRPLPSPRGPRSSIHTESVSSYDGENVSPLRTENSSPTHSDGLYDYSEDEDHVDTYSEDIIPQPRSVKEMRVAPEAKLGYTWAGH